MDHRLGKRRSKRRKTRDHSSTSSARAQAEARARARAMRERKTEQERERKNTKPQRIKQHSQKAQNTAEVPQIQCIDRVRTDPVADVKANPEEPREV